MRKRKRGDNLIQDMFAEVIGSGMTPCDYDTTEFEITLLKPADLGLEETATALLKSVTTRDPWTTMRGGAKCVRGGEIAMLVSALS